MDDVVIKVENKRILPVLVLLTIFLILFVSVIAVSILYNLLGYTIYLLIIVLLLLLPLYTEAIWLKKIYISFTDNKLIMNVLVIKNVTKKCKPKWFYPFQYRIGGGIRSNGYATRFAKPEKSEIKYCNIVDYHIINNNDLEIITKNNKYVLKQSLYGYKPWADQQFTKEQLLFVFDELKSRVKN